MRIAAVSQNQPQANLQCGIIVKSKTSGVLNLPSNKMLGAATLDRIRHGAYRVVLDGDSYRDPGPTVEGAKNTLAKEEKNTHS